MRSHPIVFSFLFGTNLIESIIRKNQVQPPQGGGEPKAEGHQGMLLIRGLTLHVTLNRKAISQKEPDATKPV